MAVDKIYLQNLHADGSPRYLDLSRLIIQDNEMSKHFYTKVPVCSDNGAERWESFFAKNDSILRKRPDGSIVFPWLITEGSSWVWDKVRRTYVVDGEVQTTEEGVPVENPVYYAEDTLLEYDAVSKQVLQQVEYGTMKKQMIGQALAALEPYKRFE